MTKPYGRIYKNKTNVSIDVLDLYNVWPVGSIYISVNNTNPSTYFGGTWVSFGAGRCLVGVDTSQTEFNTVQKTGGEKKHTLTVNEMPNNTLCYPINRRLSSGNISAWDFSARGGNQSHNNLQPYITVYMWKRTA